MGNVAYEFEVGYNVLCANYSTAEPSIRGVIVDRQPRGGGEDGNDPLYIVYLDQPLGSSYTDFFSNYGPSSQRIEFHGSFLRLLPPETQEDEDLTGLSDLL